MIVQKQAVCKTTFIISFFSEFDKYFVASYTINYPKFTLCRLSNQNFIGPTENFFNSRISYFLFDI